MSALLYKLVNFSCEGIGDKQFWTVEGDRLTDSIKQYREISVTTNNTSVDVLSSVLTIRALPINDGIDIGCNLFTQDLSIFQKGAELNVKGQSTI